MTEVKLINWKVDLAQIAHSGISLEIMDYYEILSFTDLEIEQGDDVLSDPEFKDSLSKHIYERASSGKDKGVVQYKSKHSIEN